MVYIADDMLFIGHVGHSRAYLLRDGLLTQLTRDQTLAQRLGAGGRAAPTALAAHDVGHILTDAIGGRAGMPSIQVGRIRLQPEDYVLLCTNGLTDVVDDEGIRATLLQPGSLDERCQALVDLALARGGPTTSPSSSRSTPCLEVRFAGSSPTCDRPPVETPAGRAQAPRVTEWLDPPASPPWS